MSNKHSSCSRELAGRRGRGHVKKLLGSDSPELVLLLCSNHGSTIWISCAIEWYVCIKFQIILTFGRLSGRCVSMHKFELETSHYLDSTYNVYTYYTCTFLIDSTKALVAVEVDRPRLINVAEGRCSMPLKHFVKAAIRRMSPFRPQISQQQECLKVGKLSNKFNMAGDVPPEPLIDCPTKIWSQHYCQSSAKAFGSILVKSKARPAGLAL